MNPAPTAACARGTAAPVKAGAAAIDEAALDVMIGATVVELLTVINIDDTGVEDEDDTAEI